MAKNPSISNLDLNQIVQRVTDSENDALRVELGVNSGVALQLDDTTDSISTRGISSSTKVSLTNASTGVVIPAASCVGMKSFQLYTSTTSTITGPQACTLQVSPSDTDDVWISMSLTVSPDATNGVVARGTMETDVVARRCRVSIGAAITTGTFDLYLVKQGA